MQSSIISVVGSHIGIFLDDVSSLSVAARECRCLCHYDRYCKLEPTFEGFCDLCCERIACTVQSHDHLWLRPFAALRYHGHAPLALSQRTSYVWVPRRDTLCCSSCFEEHGVSVVELVTDLKHQQVEWNERKLTAPRVTWDTLYGGKEYDDT